MASNSNKRLRRRVINHRAAKVLETISSPVNRFMQIESAGGIVLIIASVIAMIWANSGYSEVYEHFIHTPMRLVIGHFTLEGSFHYWVNDGLMVIFFYVVGMEIKRELVIGELSSPKKAALPLLAAVGGMVFPAVIYAIFNHNGIGAKGWGIPMATDIAFAIGIITLMSKKVPFPVKIFLLALAIVDDLGAVLVIAFFYTGDLVVESLGLASICFALILIFRTSGIRNGWIYLILSIVAWYQVLQSGVHATIAGVILGFLVPLKSYYNETELAEKFTDITKKINDDVDDSKDFSSALSEETEAHLSELSYYSIGAQSPVSRALHNLHPWVTFIIMPLFALVNAGVPIHGVGLHELAAHPISLGIFLGLLAGKPIGVLLTCYVAVKMKVAELPKGVTWRHMACVGFLAGIGFTMALFVSNLALGTPELEVYSKMGILIASLASSLIGLFLLATGKNVHEPASQSNS
ncbi:MAG: Na+/H+ antiporter NhaA [Bdellovibrionales bacterium]|nr:Na+/H+ antiporter NhaA [Bdellovibrionales bacterium]